MRTILAAFLAVAIGIVLPVAADKELSPELQALADAERAFAKRATVIGWRDAFLEFFADEAIVVGATPTLAKERLRDAKPQPFSVAELTWEPRTGAIAASGELGWLTGPSTSINHASPDPKPRYGNYLSVWRRQKGAPWRVFIDVGVNTPEPVPFAPGFVPFEFGSTYRGTDATPAAGLVEADRALNARVASDGAASAYRTALAPAARLHRSGTVSIAGRDAAAEWLARNAPSMTVTTVNGDAARSGDLGYSYGTYGVTGATTESGAYLRVWQRDAAGTWWIVADVTQPAR